MKRDRKDSGDSSQRRPARKASGSAAARPAARTRTSASAKTAKAGEAKTAAKTGEAKASAAKAGAAKTAAAKPTPAAAAKPKPSTTGHRPSAAKPKAAPRPAASKTASSATRPAARPARAAAEKKAAAAPAAAERRTTPRAKVPGAAAAPRPSRATAARPALETAGTVAGLSEEEQIESAKYLPRDLPPRVFEEERFIFPESYGSNRVRLLVKDPQWIFAHWDVDPGLFDGLRAQMGERAAALSRLTLKVTDPEHGGGAVIHLPEGARSWYVRTDRARRAYQAELGLTLPSGEYRLLARSNTVSPPHSGASPRRVTHRGRYVRAEPGAPAASGSPWIEAQPPAPASVETGGRASAGSEPAAGPGPWRPAPGDVRRGSDQPGPGEGAAPEAKGGASDIHRR
jgi:hypothetical protein